MAIYEVSVVMSVYNGAEYLAQTLDSILSQESCDLEFVVVDDGSTDDTGRILNERAEQDKRLLVIHQQNAGLTRALVRGCQKARGEFIARQDAGDISLPGRLKEQVAAFRKEEELSFVSCGTHYVAPAGEFLYEQAGSGVANSPVDIVDIQHRHGLLDGPSSHGSVMFRRDRYLQAGGYRPQFFFGQDWDLWYRLGKTGKFMMLPSTLYKVRIGFSDISINNKEMQEELAALSLQAFKLQTTGQSDEEVLHRASLIRPQGNGLVTGGAKARGAYFLGECLRRNGDVLKARHYLWQSILDRPLNLNAWIRLMQTFTAEQKSRG